MKLSESGVTATGFYITGLAVGASFGFVAGILFLAVAFLLGKVFSKKEKEIASTKYFSVIFFVNPFSSTLSYLTLHSNNVFMVLFFKINILF